MTDSEIGTSCGSSSRLRPVTKTRSTVCVAASCVESNAFAASAELSAAKAVSTPANSARIVIEFRKLADSIGPYTRDVYSDITSIAARWKKIFGRNCESGAEASDNELK